MLTLKTYFYRARKIGILHRKNNIFLDSVCTSIMKTALPVSVAVSALLLLTFYSIIPECSAWDPVIIEVPGYAKRVLGTTSKTNHCYLNNKLILKCNNFDYSDGPLDLSWYTKRPFNSFRSLFYASPPTRQNRFLVFNILIL